MQISYLAGRGSILGEGPLWDAALGCLWWIDIEGRALHRHDPQTGRSSTQPVPGRPGFVALHASGQLVLGIEREVVLFDPGADRGISLAEVDKDGIRINDGCCDHAGQLWFGTMDDKVASPIGALYRLGPAGPEAAINDVLASNGPAFSTDRRWLSKSVNQPFLCLAFFKMFLNSSSGFKKKSPNLSNAFIFFS